jgi:Holliday junction resolvase
MRSPRSRTDGNQKEIVAALRKAGATVQDLHTVGKGCPDLLVGYQGINYLIEVKTADGELTNDEIKWGVKWNGSAVIVRNIEQALKLIGGVP